MPEPVCYEKPQGEFTIDTTSRSDTREFFVNNIEDQNAAEAFIVAQTPPRLRTGIGGLVRRSVKATRQGPAAWFVTVEYGSGDTVAGEAPQPPPEQSFDAPLGPEWSLETTAQTAHITQAKGTRYRRTSMDNAKGVDVIGSGPDEYKAIGLTKDRVEGVDVYSPSLTFSFSVTRPNVTLAYINAALYGLVGKTNAKAFYIFDPGEVLYLGCTGGPTEDRQWRLTHKFACSPNQKDLQVGSGPTEIGGGGAIRVPFKGGWEYLWVSYLWKEVAFPAPTTVAGGPAVTEKILMQVPHCAYIQRVYDSGDFNLLGLGGAQDEPGKAVQRAAAKGGKIVGELGAPADKGIVINNTGGGDDFGGGGGDF